MGPRTMGSTADHSSARLTLAFSSRNSGCSGWCGPATAAHRSWEQELQEGVEGSGLVASWAPLHPSMTPGLGRVRPGGFPDASSPLPPPLGWGGSGLVASWVPPPPPTPGLGRVRPGGSGAATPHPTPGWGGSGLAASWAPLQPPLHSLTFLACSLSSRCDSSLPEA